MNAHTSRMKTSLVLIPTVLVGAFLISTTLSAQTGTSTITGSVTDPSGSPVPGTNIKIVNIDNGAQSESVTNEAGLYRVGALLPGSYRIEADTTGFDHLVRGPLSLAVSQTLPVDFTLTIGKQSEIVNVTEAAPL